MKLSTIYKRIKESGIEKTYDALLLNKKEDVSEDAIIKLLGLAAILMKQDEIEYKKLAYYIILKYSIMSGDHNPLYEISHDLFNIPVIELLDRINNTCEDDGIYKEMYGILKERCEKDGNFYTVKQEQMRKSFFEKDIETAIVAPTSFGKTELIKQYILENYESKNICVLVPSKAMVNQLKYDILKMFEKMEEKPKIITHYDITVKEKGRNIFVFTQERLFKFIYDKKSKIIFDTLLIDEAHRLFDKDDRDKLLARIIILLMNSNNQIVIKYFSPVIKDTKNIDFKYLNKEYSIDNSIIVQPLMLEEEGLTREVCRCLNLDKVEPKNEEWQAMIDHIRQIEAGPVKVAIVGKYVALEDSYLSVAESLRHAGFANNVKVDIDFVDSEEINDNNAKEKLGKYDALLVPGGFGNRGIEGKIATIKYARENKIPFLGICLGMQMAVVEFARDVLGLKDANSEEFDENTQNPVIHIMDDQKNIENKGGTMRLGSYPCILKEGTKAFELYGKKEIAERHRHRFEYNNDYKQKMEEAGLICSGTSPDGRLVEIVELKDHPFFIAGQFHPEFKSRPNRPGPLFKGLIAAAKK